MVACIAFGLRALAQSDATPQWRRELMGLPSTPSASTNLQDIYRFQRNLQLAGPYFAGLQPGEYEANRELIRRMVMYLVGIEMITRDPRIRLAVSQAFLGVAALRWAGGPAGTAQQQPDSHPVTTALATPPFSLQALDVPNVPKESQARLDELQSRYEFAAAHASTAWQAASVLRRSLASKGMTLNALTEASVARLQLYFELAAGAMRAQEWVDAQANLERAEAETENVRKTTGR